MVKKNEIFSYVTYNEMIFHPDPHDSIKAFNYRESFIPHKLFKYAALPSAPYNDRKKRIRSIKNEQIWMSTRKVLNDPLEFQYTLRNTMRALDAAEKAYIASIIDKTCVYCLSESDANSLMWSHYANGHRGYCIEYSVNPSFQPIFPVEYLSSFPNYIPLIKEFCKEFSHLSLSDIYSHISEKQMQYAYAASFLYGYKGGIWGYEKEYRIVDSLEKISNGKSEAANNFGLSISRILCGEKCSEQDQSDLKAACNFINRQRAKIGRQLPAVQIVKMKIDDTFTVIVDRVL